MGSKQGTCHLPNGAGHELLGPQHTSPLSLARCSLLDGPVLYLATTLEDEEFWLVLWGTTTVKKAISLTSFLGCTVSTSIRIVLGADRRLRWSGQ